MIDVTLKDFEQQVIAASMSVPVLVDFWAPWCGPCKSLGPVLEKVEADYDGRFKLVKINSDEQQQLAAAFGIRSIPTCLLIVRGQPVDGFMGALPEGQIKAFLDQHVPSAGALVAEAEADQAEALLESGHRQAALDKLAGAVAADPGNDDLRYDYARLLIDDGALDEAQAVLEQPLRREPKPLRLEALAHWLAALRFVAGDGPLPDLDAAIAANPRDFDARFAKARSLMAQSQWTAAMDELLEIILRDKQWNGQAARKTYVAILELLTPSKPKADAQSHGPSASGIELTGKAAMQQDPQAALVSGYRRKLSMALN